jgi:hypothetical protein
MRKIYLIAFIALGFSLAGQFKYQGFGIFGALTQSAHYYDNTEEDKKGTDNLRRYYYPQSHISKEFFSWGAGAFLEMGGARYRWQTELEYANKGAREMEVINPFTGDRSGSYRRNRNTYIQWNNYLKSFYNLGGAKIYWMAGLRLEYLFRRSNTVFLPVSNEFPQFWFSGDIGAGYEFHLFRKYSMFVEYHWNPDILKHTHDNIKIRNRTLELRVGFVMRPKKRSVDDCNAPVYRGPAY